MDIFEAIRLRRSVRAYLPDPIPEDKLLKILEAGRLAPSATNVQPWHFIVVTDKERKRQIAKTGRWARFIKDAAAVIVGCGDPEASPKWYMVDVAIAMQNMVLAATGLGIGTCWIGSFDEEKVKELLKIPPRLKIVALLSMGYPRKKIDLTAAALHLVRKRKKLEDIVSYEVYGRPYRPG
ncbi:MAG TPA: nitroreductase [Candidatus Bathyarchaeota archaeon]|nr:nitroreductase [Candidatus Bathyarchaeota archaeon]